jgi:hypothetical protein
MVSSVVALPTFLATLLSAATNHLCDVELAYQIVNVMKLDIAQRSVLQTMTVPVVKLVPMDTVAQSAMDPIHVHR